MANYLVLIFVLINLARVKTNPTAYFLCGILLEKQKLLNNAFKFYGKY
jgi:hypothetical protein